MGYNPEIMWQAAVNEANRAILELMEHTGAPREYILNGINRFFLHPRFYNNDMVPPIQQLPPQPPCNNGDLRRITTAPPVYTIPPLLAQDSDTDRSCSTYSMDMPMTMPMPHHAFAPEAQPMSTIPTPPKNHLTHLLQTGNYSPGSICTASSPSKTEISGILKLMSVLVALGGAPVSPS